MIALAIILGSAWVGWYRGQRQDTPAPAAADSRSDSDAPLALAPAPQVDADEAPFDDPQAEEEPAPAASPEELDAEQLAERIAAMRAQLEENRLLEPAASSALSEAARVLGVDPGNEEAREVLARALAELREAGNPVLPENLLRPAEQALALLPESEADNEIAVSVRSAVERSRALARELARAERLAAREGAGPKTFASAVEAFRAALLIDPASTRALRGLEDVQRRMLERAVAAAYDLRFDTASRLLDQAEELQSGTSRVLDARSQVMAFRAQTEAEQLTRFKDAIAARELEAAERALEVLRRLLDDAAQVSDLERKIVNVRLYGGFAPGERFGDSLPDGSRGPRMVVIPVGSFRMGSPDTEPGRSKSEGPQRTLAFARGYALARNEISVAEFRAFIEATRHTTDAERSGSSAVYDEKTGRVTKVRRVNWRRGYNGTRARDNDPVVHVSWNDARAYADWLREATGKAYRLPTEAEFEYALRAGGSGLYPWGEATPEKPLTNIAGAAELSPAGRRWNQGFPGYDDGHWGVAPVRSFDANAFRVYDLDGNVSEWVEDCWHDDYLRAPDSTAAWVNPGCELRVVRGGSWGSAREQVRSAWRGGALADSSGARVGFRVARDL
ncbi:MAG: formylglycine-generating enzyme family protein [Xanthomonadales bacterium PRO6]|nr:formylglycine-generating enzyme family protein [Xanthomonadales bacterium PRO6]